MPHAVTATSDGKSYSYDCNGNLLSDGERTFTWDADNKPVSITLAGVGTTTFAYSGDGARVRKEGGTRIIRYVGAFEDHVTDAVQVKHVFVGPLRVATRVTGGSNAGTYFPHGDHLASLNVLTSSSGVEVQRLTYLPFGETYSNSGSVDFDQRRYTGQEQDPETGLYFYQARYYNPVLGRFISPDAIVPEPGNPQSLNRYSYAINNPVALVDPSGQQFEFFEEPLTNPFEFMFGTPALSPAMDPATASQILLETGMLPPGTDAGITTGVGDLNLGTRGLGLLRVGAGVAQMAGAVALAGGTFGLALPLALTLGASGTLDLEAGIRQSLTGQPESSALSLGLQYIGIDPGVAEFVDVTRSVAGTMGAGAAASLARSGATAAEGVEVATAGQRAFAPGRWLEHFESHGAEFGYKTSVEYLRGAQSLTAGGPGVQTFIRPGGDILSYRAATNEFAVLSREGVIRTYFKPIEGIQYWLRQTGGR